MEGKKGQMTGGLKIAMFLVITIIIIVSLILIFQGIINGGFK